MSTDPKRPLGMGHGPGSQPFTKLGNTMQGVTHSHEAISPDVTHVYSGWIYDIRMSLGETNARADGKAGTWVRMHFDSPQLDKEWYTTWFRLKHDTSELLHTYGTADSIRNHRLRAQLRVGGAAIRRGDVFIIGDTFQEYQYRGFEKTPVRSWADLIHGLAGGKLPGG